MSSPMNFTDPTTEDVWHAWRFAGDAAGANRRELDRAFLRWMTQLSDEAFNRGFDKGATMRGWSFERDGL